MINSSKWLREDMTNAINVFPDIAICGSIIILSKQYMH